MKFNQNVFNTVAKILGYEHSDSNEYRANDVIMVLKMSNYLGFDISGEWSRAETEYNRLTNGTYGLGNLTSLNEQREMLSLLDSVIRESNHLSDFDRDLENCKSALHI